MRQRNGILLLWRLFPLLPGRVLILNFVTVFGPPRAFESLREQFLHLRTAIQLLVTTQGGSTRFLFAVDSPVILVEGTEQAENFPD